MSTEEVLMAFWLNFKINIMKNKKYMWIALGILAVGGYFIYKEFKTAKKLTKSESIDLIIENGSHSNREFISTFESGFLIAWANAITKGDNFFTYGGKRYNTQGATAVK